MDPGFAVSVTGIALDSTVAPHLDAVAVVVALALVWGGTLGNFYDRLQLGAVRDFIKWFYKGPPLVWPNFNIADSAICVGVGLLFLTVIRDYTAERKRMRSERSGKKAAG